MGDSYSRTKRMSWCIGCGQEILERFFLRVFPDLVWHVRCLKCAECHQFLHESRSCFLRDGRTFCREHGTRTCFKTCAKCLQVISSKEYVNRAGANVYHIQCFQCEFCKRALLPGDNCLLLNGHLLCTDHQEIDGTSETIKSTPHWPSKQSTTRIRTVLSEAQLCMLQTCYRANTKPDALTREQLVEMTGLRITRDMSSGKLRESGKLLNDCFRQNEGELRSLV
ncbi:hypothetical protein DNTS_015436 [Danionella cerebrum]|uniref:LIM zinc-binding domain-containing protein n=1 Tax=Danionella cerebrum TaxID=2873325 RepID=A0A553NIN6_9TELE|nr:hypothetical protein DNTS_015436 [Danionella translucida]